MLLKFKSVAISISYSVEESAVSQLKSKALLDKFDTEIFFGAGGLVVTDTAEDRGELPNSLIDFTL